MRPANDNGTVRSDPDMQLVGMVGFAAALMTAIVVLSVVAWPVLRGLL